MFSLLKGLSDWFFMKKKYQILILGLDNAGKTTLLEKIKFIYNHKGMDPAKIVPTVGLNIGEISTSDKVLKFWDLGGQDDLQPIWINYYKECHGIIFVIDSTDKDRLEQVRETCDRVVSNEFCEGVAVLMLANKQDMEFALDVSEIKQVFNQIAVKMDAFDSRVLPVCALTGNAPCGKQQC